jgi:hypothetical protein
VLWHRKSPIVLLHFASSVKNIRHMVWWSDTPVFYLQLRLIRKAGYLCSQKLLRGRYSNIPPRYMHVHRRININTDILPSFPPTRCGTLVVPASIFPICFIHAAVQGSMCVFALSKCPGMFPKLLLFLETRFCLVSRCDAHNIAYLSKYAGRLYVVRAKKDLHINLLAS